MSRKAARRNPIDPRDLNLYLNFVYYAVVGKTGEADQLMAHYGKHISRVAGEYARVLKPSLYTLYRGILLTPTESSTGFVSPDPQLQFVSFTEDRDVACWFADRDSYMSDLVRAMRPTVQGFIIEYTPKSWKELLFHYSWANVVPLHMLRGKQPFDLERQFFFNLATQSEVILKPPVDPLPLRTYSSFQCPDTQVLDDRLLPPWIKP